MCPRRILTDSPFDTLEKTFDLLTTGPRPLALDGTGLPGLPDRPVPLGELKARLLHPSNSPGEGWVPPLTVPPLPDAGTLGVVVPPGPT